MSDQRRWHAAIRHAARASWLLCSVLAIVFGHGTGAQAVGAGAAAGRIEAFDGSDSDYAVWRGTTRLQPLLFFEPIWAGDSLSVRRPGISLLVRVGDDTIRVCHLLDQPECRAGSPYVVPRARAVPGVIGTMAIWLGTWLTAQHEADVPTDAVVQAVTPRGADTLAVPLLAGTDVRVMAGARPVALAWRGGVAPFQVVMVTANGRDTLVRGDGLSNRRLKRDAIMLRPGLYRVVIIDDDERRFTVTVRAVPARDVPRWPPTFEGGSREDASRTLMQAAWLASGRRRSWVWEAYMRTEAVADYQPARDFASALERGDVPPAP